jgi:hypothetical protein
MYVDSNRLVFSELSLQPVELFGVEGWGDSIVNVGIAVFC